MWFLSMAGTIVIRIREEPAAGGLLAHAVAFDGANTPRAIAEELVPLAELLEHLGQPPEQNIIVLLPADRVLVTAATLPKSQAAQLARSPAFAIEDQLIEPIEQLHVVAGRPVETTGGFVRCIVMAVNHAWLQQLEAEFTGRSLYPKQMTSEAALLYPGPGQIAVWFEGGGAIVAADGVAARMERNSLKVFLELLVTRSAVAGGMPAAHLDVHATPALPEGAGQVLETFAQAHGLGVHYHEPPDSSFAALAARWLEAATASINLALTKPHAAKSSDWATVFKRLAAAAAIGIVAQAGINIAMGAYFNLRATALYRQAATIYNAATHTAAGDAGVRQALRDYAAGHSPGADSGAVPFLNRVATLLDTPGPAPRVSYLHYRGKERTLDLQMQEDGFDAFEGYRQALAKGGIETKVDALTKKSNEVEGTMHVTAP